MTQKPANPRCCARLWLIIHQRPLWPQRCRCSPANQNLDSRYDDPYAPLSISTEEDKNFKNEFFLICAPTFILVSRIPSAPIPFFCPVIKTCMEQIASLLANGITKAFWTCSVALSFLNTSVFFPHIFHLNQLLRHYTKISMDRDKVFLCKVGVGCVLFLHPPPHLCSPHIYRSSSFHLFLLQLRFIHSSWLFVFLSPFVGYYCHPKSDFNLTRRVCVNSVSNEIDIGVVLSVRRLYPPTPPHFL